MSVQGVAGKSYALLWAALAHLHAAGVCWQWQAARVLAGPLTPLQDGA